jgi:anti-sigma factor ChrR (cupin superfamily)
MASKKIPGLASGGHGPRVWDVEDKDGLGEGPVLINDDLTRRAVVHTAEIQWVASPLPGVLRKMLDRVGEEVARATSLVRYVPGSIFSQHEHGLGEEILVLDGLFSDEHGHYPVGTYLRNPPGSSHAPFSRDGCDLFVKLRQFAPDDLTRVVIDTRKGTWQPGRVAGVDGMLLHQHGEERVALVRWAPGIAYPRHEHPGGEEVFVIAGDLEDEHGRYPQGTWLRQPAGSAHAPVSRGGCLLYVKSGHLPAVAAAVD